MTNPIRWARLRLRALFGRRALERDMQDEMRSHLEEATERLVARGMSPAEARLAARREFGNVALLQEQGRDARGARWIETLAGDLRFALRHFGRHRATTAIILAVLALGTGANTLIFSMVQAQFHRPAPAVQPQDSHARIAAEERPTRGAQWKYRGFTQPEMAALAARREIFRDVAAWIEDEVVLRRGDSTGARAVGIQFVTPNLFGVLGVPLAAGQGFAQAAGDAPDLTAVLSHDAAERYYGDAASAVGKQLLVNELPVHVVGVAPPRFQGALRNMNDAVLWMPIGSRTGIARLSPRWLAEEPALALMARLAPGASHEQATAFARQVLFAALPDSAARVGMARRAHVVGLVAPLPGSETSEMMLASAFITAIGVLILLVACTNVSALMVASAVARRHEIAVRLSLGASRGRLVRQLVTESTLLAMVGSAFGLLFAWWTLTWMAKTEVEGVDLTPDAGTFTFVLVMAVATGVLFGLSPALHAIRGGTASALRSVGTGAGGGRSRLQRAFVVAQIALSQPLLVLLGVMLAMVIGDYRPRSPEMSRRVIGVNFRPLATGGPGQRPETVDSLVPRLAGRPEVLAAVPDANAFDVRGIVRTERDAGAAPDSVPTVVHLEGVAPGWFAVVDVPVILGRDVALADTAAEERAVVIGSDLARRLWGSASPIGRRLASPPLNGMTQDSTAFTVVGVYDATRALPAMTSGGYAATTNVSTRLYTAHGRNWRHDRILVRTRGPAEAFVPELRKFVSAAVPALPVTEMLTLAQVDEREYLITLRMAALAGAGGALALLLASLGLYGIVSLSVRQRTREIGIRIAVGAEPLRVARAFLVSGVRASVVALAIGLPLSIAGLKVAMNQGLVIAPHVNPYLIGTAIALILIAVASGAAWMPARRAALVDPARTLRVE